VRIKKKLGLGGALHSQTKYLPSFAKEWNNTIYSFNQNTLKNIPVNHLNINKIIKGYFNYILKIINTQGLNLYYLKEGVIY
jgi:hypothetical protein